MLTFLYIVAVIIVIASLPIGILMLILAIIGKINPSLYVDWKVGLPNSTGTIVPPGFQGTADTYFGHISSDEYLSLMANLFLKHAGILLAIAIVFILIAILVNMARKKKINRKHRRVNEKGVALSTTHLYKVKDLLNEKIKPDLYKQLAKKYNDPYSLYQLALKEKKEGNYQVYVKYLTNCINSGEKRLNIKYYRDGNVSNYEYQELLLLHKKEYESVINAFNELVKFLKENKTNEKTIISVLEKINDYQPNDNLNKNSVDAIKFELLLCYLNDLNKDMHYFNHCESLLEELINSDYKFDALDRAVPTMLNMDKVSNKSFLEFLFAGVKANCLSSYYILGKCHKEGLRGFEQDPVKAFDSYKIVVSIYDGKDENNQRFYYLNKEYIKDAMIFLSRVYKKGINGPIDNEKANYWYQRSYEVEAELPDNK